jgi:hypothetical protein
VITVPLLGGLGAVGRERRSGFGSDTQREYRYSHGTKPLQHRSYVAFHALSVRDQHHSLKAPLAFVLEGRGCCRQGAREIGGWIGEIVSCAGLEEAPERTMVGGQRQLEEGAASEHDQSEAAASRPGQQLHDGFLGGQEPGAWEVTRVHRTGQIEQHQHVAAGLRTRTLTRPELRPGQ